VRIKLPDVAQEDCLTLSRRKATDQEPQLAGRTGYWARWHLSAEDGVLQ